MKALQSEARFNGGVGEGHPVAFAWVEYRAIAPAWLHNAAPDRKRKIMPPRFTRNIRRHFDVEKVLLFLLCALSPVIASANATSAPIYVRAENIPCTYGLSIDDLTSAEPNLAHALRLDAAVRVSIDASGQISDAVLEQSSGNPTFDSLAVQASRRGKCRPFPGAQGKAVPIETNFVFKLRRSTANEAHADEGDAVASGPAAAGSVHAPSLPAGAANPPLLAAALPFEFGKPIDTTALAKYGIVPGSPKAKILEDWARKLASDPNIKNYFASNNNPATAGSFAVWHALSMLSGMTKVSQDDRARLMEMATRALDNAPSDCGGTKDLQLITSRYLSLGKESEGELRAQLRAVFDILEQASQNAPPRAVTPGQRLEGQLALAASIADALKRDPDETQDLGALMSGGQGSLSPVAWCKAMRVYRHAVDETPQPSRDWIELSDLGNQMRLVMMTALKSVTVAQAARQTAAAPKVSDYGEKVRQRIRPNIIWNGKVDHQETVVGVSCSPSGNLESVKIIRSSGDPAWDSAALEAVKRSDPMPLDESGRAPPSFSITLRP